MFKLEKIEFENKEQKYNFINAKMSGLVST